MARESKKSAGGIRWRLWLGLAAGAVVCVSTAMAALKVREYALTDSQFMLSRDNRAALTIQGLTYASHSKVQRVFAADFDRSIFSVPLDERRRRLLAIDWVEDASVSRIWPDRLVVRLRERKPVAYVLFRPGVLLIDAYGALLGPPPQAQFTFPVLSGVREDQTEAQRRDHVRLLLRIEEEMGYLAPDLSEVDTTDFDNVRLVVQVEHRALELLMGDGNYARRYQNFLSHYPEIRRQSPEVKTFDLRLDDRITAKE
jgi:cell division protein FtsQ